MDETAVQRRLMRQLVLIILLVGMAAVLANNIAVAADHTYLAYETVELSAPADVLDDGDDAFAPSLLSANARDDALVLVQPRFLSLAPPKPSYSLPLSRAPPLLNA